MQQMIGKMRPQTPGAPWYGLPMPMMMLGAVIYLVAFGVSLYLAGLARSVFGDNIHLLRLPSTENGARCR